MDHGWRGGGRARLGGGFSGSGDGATGPAHGRRSPAPAAGRLAAGLALALPLVACSATSSVQHRPAQFAPIEATRIVDDSAGAVRRRLITRLPGAGLVGVENESGVVVSLTTNHPERYVDCGRTWRTFDGAWGEAESFEYAPAASASYKLTSYQGVPLEATRHVALNATATVRMTPSDAMTEVSIDVSYDLETQVAYRERGLFAFAAEDAKPVTKTIRFHTDRPGVGDGEVAACMSNGRLEAQILDLAT